MPLLNLARRGLAAAGGGASRWAMRNAFAGGARGAAGLGAAGVGDALRYGSRMGDYALSASLGAVGGGVYGAFSDNTSVLGGMAMGAGLGAGALFGGRFAQNMGMYYGVNLAGMGRKGAAGAMNMAARGASSARNFGARLWSNRPIQKV